jgi:hypothetical protein
MAPHCGQLILLNFNMVDSFYIQTEDSLLTATNSAFAAKRFEEIIPHAVNVFSVFSVQVHVISPFTNNKSFRSTFYFMVAICQ